MADYPDSISYLVDPSRVFINQNTHSAIVIHGTGGNPDQTAQELGDYFRTTVLVTSVHYGVDRAGNVCQYVLEADGSGANCCVEPGYDPFWNQFNGDNLNRHTLAIEHVNDDQNSLPLTGAQKAASFKLIAYLSKKYNIPFSCIKSHASIAPQSRAACPGPAFPWDELEAYLNGGNSMSGVPNGWHDDGQTLTAPNRVTVIQGFRQWILTHNWDSNNVPLLAAQGANPVEQGRPDLEGGVVQPFMDCVLAWTGRTNVYVMPGGHEFVALHQAWNKTATDLKAAQAQITLLQQQLQQAQNASPALKDYQNRLNQIAQIARIP